MYKIIAGIAVLLLSACYDSSTPMPLLTSGSATDLPPMKFKPFISGHRGGSGYAPEDTMSAYRNAARLGVDDFETDTIPTKDGVLVLIHDDSVDRTTNCTGKVNSFTFADIQKCDAGYWWAPNQTTTSEDTSKAHPFRGRGVVIPAAQELFDFAKSLPYGPTVTIEIKNGPNEAQFEAQCATTAKKLVDMIHASGIQDRIIVQSFDPSCIDKVKSLDKKQQTLYLALAGATENVAYCAAMGHDFSSPSFDTPDFNAQVVAIAHMRGVKVNPYTVDTDANIRKVIGYGVDGLITNFPACMMKIQGRPYPTRLLGLDAGPDIAIPLCNGG